MYAHTAPSGYYLPSPPTDTSCTCTFIQFMIVCVTSDSGVHFKRKRCLYRQLCLFGFLLADFLAVFSEACLFPFLLNPLQMVLALISSLTRLPVRSYTHQDSGSGLFQIPVLFPYT